MNTTADQPKFSTQPWGQDDAIKTRAYVARRVTFVSQDCKLVGNLFIPNQKGPSPAIVIVGPVAFVKEQVPLQYATRLATQGFTTLIFDPRFHGESEGEPRRFESPAAKIEDISAAIDFLVTCSEVDATRISVLGVCQGVNWAIEAALVDPRISATALVAGHYLTPDVARMYLGGEAQVEARMARGHVAEAKFKATGEVDYTSIIASSFSTPNPDALLMAPFVQSFYHRWADRHAMLAHRGLWENRIATMSEHLIWGHRTDIAIQKLVLPVLMVHADRAASGPDIPRKLFERIPSKQKKLIWLGPQGQIQFYEDPLTIDQTIPYITDFLNTLASHTRHSDESQFSK